MSGNDVKTVPIRILHEAVGHSVTVELSNKSVYIGILRTAEDTMNVLLTEVKHVAKDGSTRKLEEVYLRGSHITFLVLPESKS